MTTLSTAPDPEPRAARRAAFRAGVADMAPAYPAVFAWGLVTGVAMAQSGLGLTKAYVLSAVAYAGSAQLAALPLLVSHAPLWVTVATALMVNLRFVIYSAALRPALGALPLGRRLGLAYLIGDMCFVFYMRAAERRDPATRPAYFLGLAAANFVPWHLGSFAGLLAAGRIPAEWGLEFAGMLALLALLVPMLASRPARAGLVLATLAGITVALAVERLARPRR
jgi:predicted branched-subunit amino acid permease